MIPEIVGIDTSDPMVLSTEGSVGQGGRNESSDARLVQTLLNRVGLSQGGPQIPLVVDGLVGPKTVAAIKRYQTATFGLADGLVEARNRTIRALVLAAMARNSSPVPPRLTAATKSETDALVVLFNRSSPFAKPVSSLQTSPQITDSSLVSSRSTGFGAPFTPSGFAINNNGFSADIAIKDTGGYLARLEIIREDNPSQKQTVIIIGVFKSISPKHTLPISADFSLPSFNSTKGTIIRGLAGVLPLNEGSFFGVCQFGAIGASLGPGGGAINFFQFGFVPTVPAGCVGFAFSAGEQKGLPGASIGGGTGICVPG